jgi:hypothetical protein
VTNNEYSSSPKYRGNNQIKLGGEKMTNEYHTLSEYLQKFNKKIVETKAISIPPTRICMIDHFAGLIRALQ